MRGELKSLQNELGITFVHVTHTQPEAIALADMVVVMDTGRIDQADTANVIFDKPKTPYVARFMGGQNVLTGTVERGGGGDDQAEVGRRRGVRGEGGPTAPRPGRRCRSRCGVTASLFADVAMTHPARSIRSPGVVVTTEYQGSYVKVTLDVGGGMFVANISDGAYFAEPVEHGRCGDRQLENRGRACPEQGRHRRGRRSVSRRSALEKRQEGNRSKIRPPVRGRQREGRRRTGNANELGRARQNDRA